MRPGEVKKVVPTRLATDGAGVKINRLTELKQITRINHVGLRVRSLEAARQFYEKLGFEFIVGPFGPDPVAVMEHASGITSISF